MALMALERNFQKHWMKLIDSPITAHEAQHPVSNPLMTSDDKQKILERLFARQAIRREVGVRPIRIKEVYRMKVQKITEDRYDALMEPYVDEAFSAIDWPSSLTARILMATKIYNACAKQLEADTGYANPRRVGPNIIKLIDRYREPSN